MGILHQRLKVLIWIKFKADEYSHYPSPYWYGESIWCGEGILFRLIELILEEGDFRQWLILNIGSEEGIYFDETIACWRTIDNDETKAFWRKINDKKALIMMRKINTQGTLVGTMFLIKRC